MKQSTLHVAIIMDGNGRWATQRGLPRVAGHRAGAERLRSIVEAAPDLGIRTLTTYAFSSDNWKRPADEVEALMILLAWYLEAETPRLLEQSVRLSVIGRRDRLPARLLKAIEQTERLTAPGSRVHLRLAVDYSARESILRATQLAGGSTERFEELLSQSGPVDLLIRTGGEQRLSDFLLWECAYAELVFTTRMWPEFSPNDLAKAVGEFHRRDRRFGAAPAIPPPAIDRERWLR